MSNPCAELTAAVVGSRTYPKLALVRDFVRMLPPQVNIISGGARGVDQVAAAAAREYGHDVTEFPADWGRYGKTAGFIRNQTIVESADFVVAFWDGQSRGTQSTIALAMKTDTPYYIFDLNSYDLSEALRLLMEEANRRGYEAGRPGGRSILSQSATSGQTQTGTPPTVVNGEGKSE